MRLSKVSNLLEGQPMFGFMKRASQVDDCVHFELGDPDFDTPQHIIMASIEAMSNGETHYVDSMGMIEFRKVIQETTEKTRLFKPSLNQILVTPGANIIVYLVMKCLMNPGDEVIIPDPGFPTYFSVAKMLELKAKRVPLKEKNSFRLNPKDVYKNITSKTKLVIINSPSNPTGAVMQKEEINEIFRMAYKRHIFLLSDEVYSRMLYGKQFCSPSMVDYCKTNTIVMNSFSKAFAMTGWRLGVALGPERLVLKMGVLLQTLCSCVPPFIQRAGIAAVCGEQECIHEMIEEYRKRRKVIVDGLNRIPNISCIEPDGGFYVFPNIRKTGMTSRQFSEFALKNKVALLPGINFGKYGEGYVRLSYATNLERINKGLERLNESLRLRH